MPCISLSSLFPSINHLHSAPQNFKPPNCLRSLSGSGSINSSKGHNNQIMDGMDISSPLAHGLTVFLSFLSLLCAIFLPNVELILGLMGSTGAVGAAMILPGAITLRIMSVHGAVSRPPYARSERYPLCSLLLIEPPGNPLLACSWCPLSAGGF